MVRALVVINRDLVARATDGCVSVHNLVGVARTWYCGISMNRIVAAHATHDSVSVHNRFTIWLRSQGPAMVEFNWMGLYEPVRHTIVPVFTTGSFGWGLANMLMWNLYGNVRVGTTTGSTTWCHTATAQIQGKKCRELMSAHENS